MALAAVAAAEAVPAPSPEEQVAELVNRERASCRARGCPLPPLKLVGVLTAVAGRHSVAMAESGLFSHCELPSRRDPFERLAAAEYPFRAAAENLAGGSASPAATLAQWMASPAHRENLLGADFRELGVGHARDASGRSADARDGNGDCDCRDRGETCRGEPLRHFWTQLFGQRAGVFPLIIEGERHWTTSDGVELFLHGETRGPEAASEMRLRNDGEGWSAWRPFSQRVQWTLGGGDGLRTVFAEVRTGAGVRRACDTIWRSGSSSIRNTSESVVCDADGGFGVPAP